MCLNFGCDDVPPISHQFAQISFFLDAQHLRTNILNTLFKSVPVKAGGCEWAIMKDRKGK